MPGRDGEPILPGAGQPLGPWWPAVRPPGPM